MPHCELLMKILDGKMIFHEIQQILETPSGASIQFLLGSWNFVRQLISIFIDLYGLVAWKINAVESRVDIQLNHCWEWYGLL